MLGKNISEIRKKKGLTLSGLAERANVSKSYLSGLERNLNENPSIQVLNKIALVLEVDLETLIGENIDTQKQLDPEWIEFISELKETGIEKENIQEFKTLIEFIRWKNEKLDTELESKGKNADEVQS